MGGLEHFPQFLIYLCLSLTNGGRWNCMIQHNGWTCLRITIFVFLEKKLYPERWIFFLIPFFCPLEMIRIRNPYVDLLNLSNRIQIFQDFTCPANGLIISLALLPNIQTWKVEKLSGYAQ